MQEKKSIQVSIPILDTEEEVKTLGFKLAGLNLKQQRVRYDPASLELGKVTKKEKEILAQVFYRLKSA